jgi:hypothetical protein
MDIFDAFDENILKVDNIVMNGYCYTITIMTVSAIKVLL